MKLHGLQLYGLLSTKTYMVLALSIFLFGCAGESFTSMALLGGSTFSIFERESEDQDPTDIHFIVDESMSMLPYQEKLGKKVSATLQSLRGKRVRAHLYSSTLFSSKSAPLSSTLTPSANGTVPFSNYLGEYATVDGRAMGYNQKTPGLYLGEYISSNGTTTNNSAFPALVRNVFFERSGVLAAWEPSLVFNHDRVIERFSIARSAFNTPDGTIKLSASLSDTEFNSAIEKIRKEIVLGTLGTTNGESVACTLAHLANEIKKGYEQNPTQERSNAAFVLLTDEDTQKDVKGKHLICPTAYESTLAVKDKVAIFPQYYYSEHKIAIQLPCEKGSINGAFCSATYVAFKKYDCLNPAGESSCGVAGKTVSCSTDEVNAYYSNPSFLAHLENQGGKIPPVKKCSKSFNLISPNFPGSGNTQLGAPAGIYVNFGVSATTRGFQYRTSKNGANQVYSGTPVEFFREVYPLVAQNGRLNVEPYSHTITQSKFSTFDGVNDVPSLHQFIKSSLETSMGNGNFQISLIGNLGNENPVSCEARIDERSTTLIGLASPSQVLSICDESYQTVVDGLKHFLLFKTETSYPIPERHLGKQFLRVYRNKNTLEAGIHYEVRGSRVHFFPWAIDGGLKPGDEVSILSEE